ncbi:hypothetical protein E2320_016640, partial [Naja naja]
MAPARGIGQPEATKHPPLSLEGNTPTSQAEASPQEPLLFPTSACSSEKKRIQVRRERNRSLTSIQREWFIKPIESFQNGRYPFGRIPTNWQLTSTSLETALAECTEALNCFLHNQFSKSLEMLQP